MDFTDEKSKYEVAWLKGLETNSRTAVPFAKFIESEQLEGSMLDLGCGNGFVVSYLKSKGFDCKGVDITLVGLETPLKIFTNQAVENDWRADFISNRQTMFWEAPLDKLPFKDNEFDYTFSCDVLEHIPTDLVPKVIAEILRVTRIKTYHVIATFRDVRGGINFHPTVQPINWWQEQFVYSEEWKNKIGQQVSVVLQSRKDFLLKTEGKVERGL